MTTAEKLAVLEKRLKHVEARATASRARGKILTYDEAEAEALRWAIDELTRMIYVANGPDYSI